MAALLAGPAAAQVTITPQVNCWPTELVATVMGREGLWPVARGIANGTIGQVWANPETGRFAFLVVNAEGMTCLLLAGGDFEALAAPAAPEGEAM